MPKEFNAKRTLTIGGGIFLAILILGYGVWISRDLLFGIQSTVSGITDGTSASEQILSLSGRARHAAKVTLDGRTLAIDLDGRWTDTIALLPGYNVLTVSATDKFGRVQTHSYRVYYTGREGVQ